MAHSEKERPVPAPAKKIHAWRGGRLQRGVGGAFLKPPPFAYYLGGPSPISEVVLLKPVVVQPAERVEVPLVVGAASLAADDVVTDERSSLAAGDGAVVTVTGEDAGARLLPLVGEVERIGLLDERRD